VLLETANWKTQYYFEIDVKPDRGGRVHPSSAWYDAGSTIQIEAIPHPGYKFVEFEGSGEGAYNGVEPRIVIQLNGSVNEIAVFERRSPIPQYTFLTLILSLIVVVLFLYRTRRATS
jgi:hypothetical protein